MKAIQISPDFLKSTGMSEQEFHLEIAVLLFSKDKLTLGQASKLAGISRLQFQHLVASRGIAIHYGKEDLDHDLRTLQEFQSS